VTYNDWLSAAVVANDFSVVRAIALVEDAIVDRNNALSVLSVENARQVKLQNRLSQAVEDYRATVEDEISVAPACKCECKGS
jgi:hypothetical protein